MLNNGNVLADVGSFIRSDGSTADMGTTQQLGDVDLASDAFLSRFTDTIPLTEQALALPGMRGSGQVRDMREAASLSGDFAAVLTQYAAGASKADQLTMLDTLLETWANTSTMSATTWIEHTNTGMLLNAPDTGGMVQVTRSLPEERQALSEDQWRKLTVLERFNGRQNAFLGATYAGGTMNGLSIYAGQIPLIEAAYQSLRDSVYRGLLLQTRFKPALEAISLTLNADGLAFDFSGMDAWLIENAAGNLNEGIGDALDLIKAVGETQWRAMNTEPYALFERFLAAYQTSPDGHGSGAGRCVVAAPPDRRGVGGERAVQPQHPRQHRAGRSRSIAGMGHAGSKIGCWQSRKCHYFRHIYPIRELL